MPDAIIVTTIGVVAFFAGVSVTLVLQRRSRAKRDAMPARMLVLNRVH